MPKKNYTNLGVLSPSELKDKLFLEELQRDWADAGVLSPSEIKSRGYKYYPDNDSYGVLSPSEIKTKGK